MKVQKVQCKDGIWAVRQRNDGAFQIVDAQGRERGRFVDGLLMGCHFISMMSDRPFSSVTNLDEALRTRVATFEADGITLETPGIEEANEQEA